MSSWEPAANEYVLMTTILPIDIVHTTSIVNYFLDIFSGFILLRLENYETKRLSLYSYKINNQQINKKQNKKV